MLRVSDKRPCRLEDLPNIGKAIAGDLRSVGILNPEQLAEHEPLEIFQALEPVMGHRHDPCILYALMARRALSKMWRSSSLVEIHDTWKGIAAINKKLKIHLQSFSDFYFRVKDPGAP